MQLLIVFASYIALVAVMKTRRNLVYVLHSRGGSRETSTSVIHNLSALTAGCNISFF